MPYYIDSSYVVENERSVIIIRNPIISYNTLDDIKPYLILYSVTIEDVEVVEYSKNTLRIILKCEK